MALRPQLLSVNPAGFKNQRHEYEHILSVQLLCILQSQAREFGAEPFGGRRRFRCGSVLKSNEVVRSTSSAV